MTTLGFLENNAITKWPISRSFLQSKYPTTSFPKDLEKANLTEFNVVTIKETTKPSHDYKTQKIAEIAPVLIDGTWTQKWEITSLTTDEINNNKTNILSNTRIERDELLKESDWTQTSDSPLTSDKKTEWATYRQSLSLIHI